MEFSAYNIVSDKLMEELKNQGFSDMQPLEEEGARFEMSTCNDVAYGLKYDRKRQQFELSSTSLDDEGKPAKWRSLSVWLFDENDGTKADAESIAEDFLEVVRGPKRIEFVKKKKKGKDEERTIDPQFFFNRLVNIFPELREEINEERIIYGQVRSVTFAKEKVVPKCEGLLTKYAGSSSVTKLAELFSEMYKEGDMDLRSVISISILNSLSEPAFAALNEHFSDGLKLDTKYTRKLIGKKIKPEKKKKQKKVVAKLND